MRIVVAVGVAAVLAGFLVLVDRGLAGVLDLSYVAVTLVGTLGIVQGVRYANARRRRTTRTIDLGEPERRARAAVPGSDVDDAIDRATGRVGRRYEPRNGVRERVRALAIDAVARDRNCSRETAATLVDAGTWTDDRVAAAFLAADATYPVRVRLRARLLGRSLYRLGATAAVDAVGRLETAVPGDEP
ncbi:hypothetical protein GRS48_13555 [Halorubrum sp. JWXQ-INN 858]|uniref:DUF7269 family protein n=1 Tax=Halorubrum sp. JWXQ-INN 858 TaxID=2690782 RepID=UPI0013FA0345|nr:hypothetical protein [Halorubrum sp. JWXQ-INN 858]MWV65839.1 hypothetical protein [Halorubrum sp. JWXQ-INN 858]